MKITVNERQFNTIVKHMLNEGVLDKLYMAHVPSDKEIPNPTVKDVIERNGWIVKQQRPSKTGRGTLYLVYQKTGAFGNTEGTLDLDELIEDIRVFGKRAEIVQRKYQSEDPYTEGEKAVIYVIN